MPSPLRRPSRSVRVPGRVSRPVRLGYQSTGSFFVPYLERPDIGDESPRRAYMPAPPPQEPEEASPAKAGPADTGPADLAPATQPAAGPATQPAAGPATRPDAAPATRPDAAPA